MQTMTLGQIARRHSRRNTELEPFMKIIIGANYELIHDWNCDNGADGAFDSQHLRPISRRSLGALRDH